MTERDFTYWLQGYAEICGERPTEAQWQIIKDHLQLVFAKVTPTRSPQPLGEPTYCAPLGFGTPSDDRLCGGWGLHSTQPAGAAPLKIFSIDHTC